MSLLLCCTKADEEAELREQDLLALEEQYKKAEQTYIKYTNL